MKIEVFQRWGLRGRRFYFRIRAANGEIVAQSEAYTRKEQALHTAKLIKNAAGSADIVFIQEKK